MADIDPEVPETGAIFTFGKSKFAENAPSKFWIKRDLVIAISCGDEHTAVVTQTGRLFTFGSNEFGQLGLGHNENVLKPSCVKVLKPDKVLAVACGKAHTVVAMASGKLWAFGSNSDGQLGIGRDPESINRPYEVQSGPMDEDLIIALEAGSSHSMALGRSGAVYVWGSNKEGQLGLGADGEEVLFVPTKLEAFLQSGGPVKAISCGYYHCAMVTEDGGLYTFGEADGGKLGLGADVTEADVPTKVDTAENVVVSVSCGGDHSLFLTESGEVFSFGTSSNGQLGLGTRILETSEPMKIGTSIGTRIIGISCGENHSAVVTEDGKLLTFGDGRHGKLCLDVETLTNHYTPVPSSRFRGFHVEKAVCGGCHTMIQARPIPGFEADNESSLLPNGQLEEINLEARRRHRQEKLPPLSNEAPEDETEKILTIEQAEVVDQAEDANEADDEGANLNGIDEEQPEAAAAAATTKGHKISNFFKNFGRKKTSSEAAAAAANMEEAETSPSKQKKQVRFFGRSKKSEAEDVKAESAEDENEAESDEAESDEDEDVSSIEEAADDDEDGQKEAKVKKHVTISSKEDIRSSGENGSSPSNSLGGGKKSKSCTIL